jgi:hypothetical protein
VTDTNLGLLLIILGATLVIVTNSYRTIAWNRHSAACEEAFAQGRYDEAIRILCDTSPFRPWQAALHIAALVGGGATAGTGLVYLTG